MLLKNFLAFRQFKPSFAHQNEHLETYEKSVNEVFSLISNLKDEDLVNIPEAHSGLQTYKRIIKCQHTISNETIKQALDEINDLHFLMEKNFSN